MRYEWGAWASHFVCISFSLFFFFFYSCSIAFLVEVKCCSEANTAKSTLSFLIKEQNENLIHVDRFEQINVNTFELLVQFTLFTLFAPCSLWLRQVWYLGVKRWSSHCFSSHRAGKFAFMFSLRQFISFTYCVIDELTSLTFFWEMIFLHCVIRQLNWNVDI